MKASEIFGNPSPEVIRALGIDAGYIPHKVYSHTITLAGKPLARCIGSDFSTDPVGMTLALEEGVDESEVRDLLMFADMDITIVCGYCEGTGEVSCDEDDGEGHMMRGVGTQKCICQIEK